MKVRLNQSQVRIEEGRQRSYQQGDVIDVSEEEAKRLIAKNRAVAVGTQSKRKTKAKSGGDDSAQSKDD